MSKSLRDARLKQADGYIKALSAEKPKIEKQVGQLLERILDARVPSVIDAYENRIQSLEAQKVEITEKMAETTKPKSSYEKSLRAALGFLANPWSLWKSRQLELRRTVLKLAFSDRLHYSRNKGFGTANLSFAVQDVRCDFR